MYRRKEVSRPNIGVDPGVRTGMEWFFRHVEYGIMLEDDCILHPHFFTFCGELLARYYDDERVMQISSLSPYAPRKHPYDYHFSRMFRCSGGWATWRRAWKYYTSEMGRYSDQETFAILKACNWDYPKCLQQYKTLMEFQKGSRNQWVHWDFQWNMACHAQNGLAIVPEKNLMINIGFDEESTHTQEIDPIFQSLRTQPLVFPLRHPPLVYADSQPERSLEKKIYRNLSIKSRCVHVLRQVLGGIAYLSETLSFGERRDTPDPLQKEPSRPDRHSSLLPNIERNMRREDADIRITFGMIVFNGEPFVKYNLSSVYPLAHQIIVVEGACRSSAPVARPDGHSTDGTLELLYRFKRELDRENKVVIVTAGDEGRRRILAGKG